MAPSYTRESRGGSGAGGTGPYFVLVRFPGCHCSLKVPLIPIKGEQFCQTAPNPHRGNILICEFIINFTETLFPGYY
jgi:hypothetical protein